LSIAGRGLVASSLLLSRVWHTTRILAVPQTFLQKLRSIIIKFLAHKAFPAVSFATCTRPRREGGLGVLDPFAQHAALQLRWVLSLLHIDSPIPSSFAMPFISYCIRSFTGTVDTAIPLVFSACRTSHLKALSPIKNFLNTADELGPQPNMESYDPGIVLELPILALCADLPRRPPTPTRSAYQWSTILVKDAFYFNHTLGRFRRLTPPTRTARGKLLHLLFECLDNHTAHIHPALQRFFTLYSAGSPVYEALPFAAHRLFLPTLRSGTALVDLTNKKFRQALRPRLEDLPDWYPRAPASAWKSFWSASWPHHARTIFWRAYHAKLPSRERLHKFFGTVFTTPLCPLCNHLDTDQHFIWACPKKQQVWQGIARQFLQRPADLKFEHLSINPPSQLMVCDITHVTARTIIACTFLELWRAHWRFVFECEPFWPNGVVARTIRLLRRIEAENKL
ncbi:hypothetical protein BJV82DRAFT_523146, partial [Fennellomyces sp. T-0311]